MGQRREIRLRGTLKVMKYHGLDEKLKDEAYRIEQKIALLETVEAQLAACAALFAKAKNA
jgi:uncharacterized protein YbaP (TraB family)